MVRAAGTDQPHAESEGLSIFPLAIVGGQVTPPRIIALRSEAGRGDLLPENPFLRSSPSLGFEWFFNFPRHLRRAATPACRAVHRIDRPPDGEQVRPIGKNVGGVG